MSNGALSMDEIMDLLNGVDAAAKGEPQKPSDSGVAGSNDSGGTSVLSQDEIGILLNAVNASEKNEIKDYDENIRPMLFSKKHIREIMIIHEKFALMAMKSLSDQLRSQVTLSVASVDQLYMGEFNRCIPVPGVLALVSLEPFKGYAVIEIDPSLTSAIINKIGGGNKKRHEQWYALTAIQKKIIEGIFDCILENLRNAWSEIIALSPRLIKIEPDPQFIRNIPPSEWVALVTVEAKVWNVESMINICIPYPVIEPVLEK